MTGKILTAKQVAEYLAISRPTFYNMLRDGRFTVPPIPGTKPRRWAIESVDAWRLGTSGGES